MSKTRSLLHTSIHSTVSRFLGVGLNYTVILILTNTLSTDESGMVLLLMVLIPAAALFSRLGVEQWLVRDVARLPATDTRLQAAYLRDAYKLVLLSSGIFIALWLVCIPVIQQRLFDNAIHTLPLWLAAVGILLFNVVMMNAAFLKAVHHTSPSLLVQNSLPAVTFLVLIGLFWQLLTVNQTHLLLYSGSLLLAGLLSFWWLRPWWRDLFVRQNSRWSVREVWQHSLPLAPVSLLAFLLLWADTLLTGWLLNNHDVALYSVAARLSFVSLFFLGAMDATIYPRLLRIHQQQPERVQGFFWKATALVAGILGSVTLLLLLLSDVLLALFKPEYLQAGTALSILLLAQLIRALSLTFSFMFIIKEQVRYLNILLGTALGVDIAANLLLIPPYGIAGAASATLLANLVLTGGVVVLFFKHHLLTRH
jgi:O-antigen/teichoic acid export membrane protein